MKITKYYFIVALCLTIMMPFSNMAFALYSIPPTNAFDKIHTDNGTVHSVNYSMPVIIEGAGGITVHGNNGTHKIIINGTAQSCNATTITDETANRSFSNSSSNVYHNITGKTMFVVITFTLTIHDANTVADVQFLADPFTPPSNIQGEQYISHLGFSYPGLQIGNAGTITGIVPNGYYYEVQDASSPVNATTTIQSWYESLNPQCGSTAGSGTYKQTLANNVIINSGGNRTNYINGTGNPVHIVNDPTRNQVNVTISNSAMTKQGTYNETLGNNVLINSGGYKINFINGTGATAHLVNTSTGVNITISATGTAGVSMLNGFTGNVNLTRQNGNTTITNSSGTIQIGLGNNVDIISLAQTISGVKTFNNGTLNLRNPANTFSFILSTTAITQNEKLTIPKPDTSSDTFAYLGTNQSYTGEPTWGQNAKHGAFSFGSSTTAPTSPQIGECWQIVGNIRCISSTGSTTTLAITGTNTFIANETITTGQNIFMGTANVTTSAVRGFFYFSAVDGTPTGTPAAHTGSIPCVYDGKTNRLWCYNGAWKSTQLS